PERAKEADVDVWDAQPRVDAANDVTGRAVELILDAHPRNAGRRRRHDPRPRDGDADPQALTLVGGATRGGRDERERGGREHDEQPCDSHGTILKRNAEIVPATSTRKAAIPANTSVISRSSGRLPSREPKSS